MRHVNVGDLAEGLKVLNAGPTAPVISPMPDDRRQLFERHPGVVVAAEPLAVQVEWDGLEDTAHDVEVHTPDRNGQYLGLLFATDNEWEAAGRALPDQSDLWPGPDPNAPPRDA